MSEMLKELIIRNSEDRYLLENAIQLNIKTYLLRAMIPNQHLKSDLKKKVIHLYQTKKHF